MKYIVQILFIFLCSFYFFNCNSNVEKKLNYISLAELEVCKEDYNKACVYYSQALKKGLNFCGVDYYNFLLSAINSKNVPLQNLALGKIKSIGIDKSFYSDPFHENLLEDYLQNENNYRNKENDSLNSELTKLYRSDQSLYCGIDNDEKDIPDYFEKFIELWNKSNGITEEKVGIGFENSKILFPKYHVIMKHAFQDEVRPIEYKDLVYEALNIGSIKPQEYISLIETINTNGNKYLSTVLFAYKNGIYKTRISEDEKERINSNRTAVGADPIDIYIQKALFTIKNKRKRFNLIYGGGIAVFYSKMEESSDNNLILIDTTNIFDVYLSEFKSRE